MISAGPTMRKTLCLKDPNKHAIVQRRQLGHITYMATLNRS